MINKMKSKKYHTVGSSKIQYRKIVEIDIPNEHIHDGSLSLLVTRIYIVRKI